MVAYINYTHSLFTLTGKHSLIIYLTSMLFTPTHIIDLIMKLSCCTIDSPVSQSDWWMEKLFRSSPQRT